MNNGYGCIWTRVRVLSVLTAGDPGLVRVRLASTSHQRRPGVLPASVPPRPPRRAQRSSSGESLDSGVRRSRRRRRGGARTPRAVSSKIQADLGSYERVYDVCVCPRAAAARHVVVAGRAGRSQQCAALSGDERQQRYETFLSSHRHRHHSHQHICTVQGDCRD